MLGDLTWDRNKIKKNTHTQQTLNKTQWRWGKKDKMRTKNKKENTNMMEQQWKRQANRTKTYNRKHVSTVLNETRLKHTLDCMFFFPKTMSQGTKLKQKDVSNSFRLN